MNLLPGQPIFRFSWLLILAFALLGTGCQAEPAEPPAELLCATYCVGTPFEPFYNSHGGRAVFGEPISGVLEISQQPDVISQYFESMRLDYNTKTDRISIPDLGRWAFEGLSQKDQETLSEAVRGVAMPFRDFYNRYGGESLFGKPLSPLVDDGALRVQYFENGRLEWQPGLSTTSGLYSGSIGRAHYDQTAYAFDIVAQPLPPDQRLERVNLSAVVAAPILYAGETQTFYIRAVSPAQSPADNLRIEIAIQQDGETTKVVGITDIAGRVAIELTPDDIELVPGERLHATISAFGAAEEPLETTTISFENWW